MVQTFQETLSQHQVMQILNTLEKPPGFSITEFQNVGALPPTWYVQLVYKHGLLPVSELKLV